MGFEWDRFNRSRGTRLEKTNTNLTPLIKLMALSPEEVLSNTGNTRKAHHARGSTGVCLHTPGGCPWTEAHAFSTAQGLELRVAS